MAHGLITTSKFLVKPSNPYADIITKSNEDEGITLGLKLLLKLL